MSLSVPQLIKEYQLLPHPEGGYYKETYRSAGIIPHAVLPGGFNGSRAYATTICFLLEKGNFSAFHRIQSDECWHFYAGSPLHVHVIHPNGVYEKIRLANNPDNGQFQAMVSAGSWFASETIGDFSFVGCTVSPGFDFADFELAGADSLTALYPEFSTLIQRMVR